MVADRKLGHFSRAWSLPVVVAVMFLLVVKLAALQRAGVIAELADRVAHGETSEATSAVRSLARIPRPPLAELVSAAASPNLEVAREAQDAIDDYLRFCRREIRAQRHMRQLARQLAVLAEALAVEQPSFAPADYVWLESATRQLLLLVNRIASRNTPLVAKRCDEILTAISAGRPSQPAPLAEAAPRADLTSDADAQQKRRDRRLAALAAEPWTGSSANAQDGAPTTADGKSPSSAAEDTAIPLSVSEVRRAAGDALSSEALLGDEAALSASPTRESDSDWQAQWSHPVLRTLPAQPINRPPVSADRGESGPFRPREEGNRGRGRPGSLAVANGRDDSVAAVERFSGVNSRKLLARWVVAEGSDVYPLEEALTERGFGRLSARMVQQLFSERVEDRLRLVDDVLTQPGVDARPWLMLLAEDGNADVRLVVVTIMATSNDRALVEKAWQVAIRDRDPRIAGLAERLRERRGETRR